MMDCFTAQTKSMKIDIFPDFNRDISMAGH